MTLVDTLPRCLVTGIWTFVKVSSKSGSITYVPSDWKRFELCMLIRVSCSDLRSRLVKKSLSFVSFGRLMSLDTSLFFQLSVQRRYCPVGECCFKIGIETRRSFNGLLLSMVRDYFRVRNFPPAELLLGEEEPLVGIIIFIYTTIK